ncbi:hypothetical protein A5761_15075 [Mycolicibacterium setense]|uniref:hypothetical protein n=1 Tax=Mycolicibacterium setense TaxID=431269 RepID=UPI0007EB8553|nr:hypothetical protein [Mycolicibacterium setense]OBB15062.1 hypothetical protein A5761_15075 [Mycolicibacterium setense]
MDPAKTYVDLKEIGSRPARVVRTAHGFRLFIGDEEFPFPIERDSVSFTPGRGRHNRLTLTLFVGEVTMETRKPSAEGND